MEMGSNRSKIKNAGRGESLGRFFLRVRIVETALSRVNYSLAT